MALSVQDILREIGHLAAELARVAADVLNSNFGTALVGAAAGAVAGAWAAQLIASRVERRKAQREDIRNANAAVNLAAGIVNSYIGVKRQFILPMVADLRETGARFDAYKEEVKTKGLNAVEPFEFKTEFRTFSPVQTPIGHLQEILFNKVSADHFMLSAYQLLAQAIGNGTDTLAQRNAMVEQFRDAPAGATPLIVLLYLGRPRPDGPADERYPNFVKGLQDQADDCIIFGKALAERLSSHAQTVSREYGHGAPKPAVVDFSRPEKLGLLPDEARYKDLMAALRGEGPGNPDEAAARVGPAR
jgi:gas vesicle protein